MGGEGKRIESKRENTMQLVLAFFLAAAAAWQPVVASTLPTMPPVSPTLPAPYPSAPAPTGGKPEDEFVRSCCAHTLYPRLCRAGLAPYAASVRSSHARLALASANLTLAALNSLAGRIPSASNSSSSSSSLGSGLSDCAEAVAAAADLTAHAAERLDGVERAVGPEVLWRVDDAQTWLSAAMTYEDTCADGLRPGKSAPAPVRAELRARVRLAKQYTSIALALVNMLVHNP